MENATKALEIAGGVLIALMVLGIALWEYRNISSTKQLEANVSAEQQATDFNKEYESFNKDGLYGSQIFSLANKVEDYNKNESEKKGYEELTLRVTFNNLAEDYFSYSNGAYIESKSKHSLTDTYKRLEKDIASVSKEKVTCTDSVRRTYKDLSSKSSKTLRELLGPDYTSTMVRYTCLIDEQNEVTRVRFKQPKIQYNNTGRMILMEYEMN